MSNQESRECPEHPPELPLRRKSRLWAVVLLLAVFAVVVIALLVVWSIHRTTERIADQYAALQASDMLISFMETHHGRWPKRWEDLHDACDVVAARGENYCTFDEVKKRVWVDFGLTINDLRRIAQGSATERRFFLRLQSGEDAAWCDSDRNASVAEYIRDKGSRAIRGQSHFRTPETN
jgi:hypothetical protein